MQARLVPRYQVKGDNEENRRLSEIELKRCQEMGIAVNTVLKLDQLAHNDNVIFSATGVTKGDLLEGVSRQGNIAHTETLVIRGKSRTVRRIQSIHYLDRKDPEIRAVIC
jgi:fructose-1,6-bisphosphatase II